MREKGEKGKERDKRTMERGDKHYKTFHRSCFTHIKCSRSFISLGNDVLQDKTAHDHTVYRTKHHMIIQSAGQNIT